MDEPHAPNGMVAQYTFQLESSIRLLTDGSPIDLSIDCGAGVRVRFKAPGLPDATGDELVTSMHGVDAWVGEQDGAALWEFEHLRCDVTIDTSNIADPVSHFSDHSEEILAESQKRGKDASTRFLRWARLITGQAHLPDHVSRHHSVRVIYDGVVMPKGNVVSLTGSYLSASSCFPMLDLAAVESAMTSGGEPPVGAIYLLDAKRSLLNGETTVAFMQAAIACEVTANALMQVAVCDRIPNSRMRSRDSSRQARRRRKYR